MYSAWIEFLESLLPSFIGIKWIKHKKYIETQIGYLKKQIESEQIKVIVRRMILKIHEKKENRKGPEWWRTKDNLNIIGSEIIVYQTDDGQTKIDVKFETQLFGLHRHNYVNFTKPVNLISVSISSIFLKRKNWMKKQLFGELRTTASYGKNYNTIHYNLDMIIFLGYRVKSKIATNFRRWATERLKKYMIKGFTMVDDRLKNLGGGNYWKELLDRIGIFVYLKK